MYREILKLRFGDHIILQVQGGTSSPSTPIPSIKMSNCQIVIYPHMALDGGSLKAQASGHIGLSLCALNYQWSGMGICPNRFSQCFVLRFTNILCIHPVSSL